MIKKDRADLYSPKISKVICVSRMDFIPLDADGLLDNSGNILSVTYPSVYYDRNNRGKSWFILDLRT